MSIKHPTLNPVTTRPIDLYPGDRLGFKIIAVIGGNNDWAAYRGLTLWSDDEVVEMGDKLGREDAEKLFYAPVAMGLKYRS